jgi:hypothetical protein
MALHMIKLCVGADTVEDLAVWQASCAAERAREGLSAIPFHDTRMHPRRAPDILDGGSIYWVIRHRILVRQRITGFEAIDDAAGKPMCRILLAPDLVPVQPRRKRPFQGWRYLEPKDAPADRDGRGPALSADLEAALKEAMVW